MSLRKEKFAKLLEIGGYADDLEFMQAEIMDIVCLAICMNPECSYTEDLEPDQKEGWCAECGTNSMKSGLILAGVI